MEAGVEFAFFSSKISVSATVAKSVKSDVSYSSSFSTDETWDFSCMPPDGDNTYGTGLYQWQVDNGTVTAMTNVLICRTGENWTSPPNCPPSACKTSECEECYDWEA